MRENIIIAVDAMGGENSPKKIIDAINLILKEDNNLFFKLFGNENIIKNLINNNSLVKNNCEIINTDLEISDDESPLQAAKKNNKTSMWQAINSVKLKESDIALSAGNTGALLILSKIILEMIPGIDKPALAGLWPNKINTNLVLDLGANIECTEKNLIDFSYMGASLYKSLFQDVEPNVALLNVGSEQIKGTDMLKKVYKLLNDDQKKDFKFSGYIEGNHIMEGNANVIVTDGFTGNIALKTAEGTAEFVTNILKDSLKSNFYSKVLTYLNYFNFKKFKNKLDPRKYNGAIFLGLNGPVVKSHGATDFIGFSNSIKMCKKIVKGNLVEKIKKNLN